MRVVAFVAGVVMASFLFLPGCGGGGGGSSPTAPAPPAPPPPTGSGTLLASGQFALTAAQQTSGVGFHQPFSRFHSLPANLSATAGTQVVVSLRDSSRPTQSCSSEHPLSGCATVDWSDNPGVANTPPSGVFDNSLTVQLTSGNRQYFLSESGVLADVPDAFSPT